MKDLLAGLTPEIIQSLFAAACLLTFVLACLFIDADDDEVMW